MKLALTIVDVEWANVPSFPHTQGPFVFRAQKDDKTMPVSQKQHQEHRAPGRSPRGGRRGGGGRGPLGTASPVRDGLLPPPPQSRKRPFSWQQSPALHLSASGALQQGTSLDFTPARRWGHCSCSLTLVTHALAFMGCTEESMINAHSVMMHGTGPILQMPSPPPRVSQKTASR